MASPPTSSPRRIPLWRNLNFTLMWTSTAASGFGDRMIMLAALALLGGLAEGTMRSTAIQASTQFWFFLPYIFVSVLGGWLADHLPRKWLLLSCDEARGLILLTSYFLLAEATGTAEIDPELVWFTVAGFEVPVYWKVYVALGLIGCFAATFNPTRNAIIPQIIPRPQLQAANAVILVLTVVASMMGLLVGKELINPQMAGTVRHGLLLGALFYLISGSFFAFLRPLDVEAREAQSHRSLLQALRYALRHRRVLILIGLNLMIWSSAAVVSSGLMGLGRTHHDLAGNALLDMFGNTSATLGAGMLVGAGLVTLLRTRRESTGVTMAAVTFAGAMVLVLAAVPVMAVTYAATFLLGMAGNVAIITIITMLQSISPNYVRGRIMGLNSMANVIFSVTTYFLIWQLPEADRTIITVMLVLGPALTGVGVVGLVRHLRRGPMAESAANRLWRLDRLYALVWHRLQWEGRANIPREGAVILASNHTTGLDPLLIQAACPRVVHWVMLKSYQFRVLNWVWRVIEPISLERGAGDRARIRQVVQTLKEGKVVGFFPEGGLQRAHRELGKLHPGISMIAQRSGAWVVPVWIEGTPRRRNMLWHFLQPSRSRVTFGEPYRVDPDQPHEQVLAELRERMEALAGKTE
ncbi:MAG: MFS transporter [Phycisphaeraceae bacterium]